VNAPGLIGQHAMHSAAVYGRVGAVRKLHELGAEVDARAANGCLPIHLAARTGQLESVKVRDAAARGL
jgi:ankyrin repeat protein